MPLNAEFFSKLNVTQGYWQVKLDEESSNKCTFNTPFGISSALEVYQKVVSQIFNGNEGVEVIVDDLLIWGETQEQHGGRLKQAL